jgi:hypothetical protein
LFHAPIRIHRAQKSWSLTLRWLRSFRYSLHTGDANNMDPRSPLSPAEGTRGVKRRAPSPSENIQQLHTVNPAQTSLPSISQLVNAFGGPPQSAMSNAPQGLTSSPEAGYYAQNTHSTPSSYMHERDVSHVGYGYRGGSGAGSIIGGGGDSEHDEVGIIDGPPKKKRRRQALSCTGESFSAFTYS